MAPRSDRSKVAAADQAAQLKRELAARVAEAEWLKAHYERHLREALARVSQPERLPVQPTPAASPAPAEDKELKALRHEVDRMQLAEKRYLDRIDELKEALSESERERPDGV